MNCDLSKWSMYISLFNIKGNIWCGRQLWYIWYVLIRCGFIIFFPFAYFHAMCVFSKKIFTYCVFIRCAFFFKKNYELRISYNFFHVLRISRDQCISWQYSLFDIYLLKVKGPYPNYCLIEASARNGHIRVNQSLYRRYTDEPMKRQYINHNLETVPTVWLWHFSILQPSRHARNALGQFRNLIMKSHTNLLVLLYRLMKFFDIVAVWLQRVLCQCTVQGRPRNLIMKLP